MAFKMGVSITGSTTDDDVSAIIGEYSMPTLADITSESLLTQSQYAKVIFHDLLPSYPTDANIWCRYSLTEGITSRHGDRVALYRVGWSSVHDHVQFEMAPVQTNSTEKEFQVLFKAETLPKDCTEFYQLCYVNVNESVCGASVPFQFRHPSEEELCEVEEQGGLLVVRSRTAINGDKLRDAAKLIEELETEKQVHEEKIQALESTKDSLSLKLEELTNIQNREALLKLDIQKLDVEKNRAFENLHQAENHIQDLNKTITVLRQDKSALSALLKSEAKNVTSSEISRLQVQLDNMQQMLDALTQSKELAQHALQCEQSKVMALNIEHDKYKFRAQHLERENDNLKLELQQCQAEQTKIMALNVEHEKNKFLTRHLEQENNNLKLDLQQCQENYFKWKHQLEENEALLQLKSKENESTSKALIQQIGQTQFELRQAKDYNEALQLQIQQRDNQILMMQKECLELRAQKEICDNLGRECEDLRLQLREWEGKQVLIDELHHEKLLCYVKLQKLQEEVSLLKIANQEKVHLKSEHELLSAQHKALQEEFYFSSLNSTNVQELKDQNTSLQHRLAELSKKETELDQSTVTLEQVKSQLAGAEASNASLLYRLQQIRVEEPDGNTNPLFRDGNPFLTRSCSSEATAVSATDDQTPDPPGQESGCSEQMLEERYKRLQNNKGMLEIEFRDFVSQENDFKKHTESVINRLEAIVDEVAMANTQIDILKVKYQRDVDGITAINNRMTSVQRQLLRVDGVDGRADHDADEERLVRMTKRLDDLQHSAMTSESQIYDMEQNILVLNEETACLREEIKAKPLIEKQTAENKCQILEKLVSLDQTLLCAKEELFAMKNINMMSKFFIDWPVQNSDRFEAMPIIENVQSCERSSTILCEKFQGTANDATATEQLVHFSTNATNIGLPDCFITQANVAPDCINTSTVIEPIDKAVADGVREGLKCGINSLREKAVKSISLDLSPDSIITTPESLTRMQEKCGNVEKVCQEKERVLQEKLAVVLTDAVRKKLSGDAQDLSLETATTKVSSAGEATTTAEEAELKLRLEMAADEYRKLYTEKLKLEKRLAKAQLKQVASVSTVPQSPSFRSGKDADKGNGNGNMGYVCPICRVTFKSTESHLLIAHFEDHLS